jgi:acetyltransferase-like isoleucine patch superfamily enzyme
MSSYLGAVHLLTEHVSAVSHYGSGEPEPGWYLYQGFRTSNPVRTGGPFEDVGACIRELAWRQSLDSSYFNWPELYVDPRRENPEVHDPIFALAPARIRIHLSARVDSFVKLEGGIRMMIGKNVHIASFCHLGIGGGETILEEGSSFGSGAKIISGSNTYGRGHGCSAIAPDATFKRSFVHVKKNATLYAGAIVLPGVTIGENSVIAAGAVVRQDVGPYQLWAGNPAVLKKTL